MTVNVSISVTGAGGTQDATVFATYAAALNHTPESAPDHIRTEGRDAPGDCGGALYKKVEAEPSHAGKFPLTLADGSSVSWYEIAEEFLNSKRVGGVNNLATVAYAIGARIVVKAGETAKLPCDPSSGDDLVDMAEWQVGDHLIENGGSFYIEVADGLHTVPGHIAFYNGRLDIRATGLPDEFQIESGTAALTAGDIFNQSVTITGGVFPARVQPGFVVGGQNCKGLDGTDRGIEAWNGAHKVTTRASDTRIFASVQSFGKALTSTSNAELDGTVDKGLSPNRILVPKCTLVLDGTGWNGTSGDQEGFLNVLGPTASAYIQGIGFAYTGATDEHDMFFQSGGGVIETYRCFIAGTGDKVLRGAYGGRQYHRYSFFGGSTTGQQLWQGVAGADIDFVRCCMGSVSNMGISGTATSRAWLTQCCLSSCSIGINTSYASAQVDLSVCDISNCYRGISPTRGSVNVAADTKVKQCDNPLSILGVGYIYGAPTIVDNVNPTIAGNTYLNGGGWYEANAPLT